MKILYISVTKPNSSVDGVYIQGLKKLGIEVQDYFFHNIYGFRLFGKVYDCVRKHKNSDFIFAGYSSPHLVIFTRLVCRKPIIYNALCSMYERMILSRSLASKFSLKACYYWLLDFLAVSIARFTILETSHQVKYFQKLFFLPESKFFHSWTGVDGNIFYRDANIKKFDEFTALFRGRLLPEAGGDLVVRAAKLLEQKPVKVLMIANGIELPKIQKLIAELKPKNLELITEFLPDAALRVYMQRSHISLGQLSGHERLLRTIPHKAYESLALGLPYLTARNPGVLELLKEGETCIACNPADPRDLAEKILWAKNHPNELDAIAQRGYELYQRELTSVNLAKKVFEKLQNDVL